MAAYGMSDRVQIEASDALYDFSCLPCSDDGKNTEAVFHCADCEIFYCEACVLGHNKFTKNHHVVEKSSDLFGQGRRPRRSASSSELPTDLCEEHHGEVIKMYCGEHDVVCCTVCIAVKHRSCESVDYIPNVAKELLKGQETDKTKTSLEKVKNDLQKLKSKRENLLKELNQQRDRILDDIQKFKKRIIERVEVLEKKSIEEVKDKHKAMAADLTASCKIIDDLLGDVGKQLDKIKHSNNANAAQAFVDIKYAELQISNGNKCMGEPRQEKTMKFEVNRSIDNFLLEVQSLGNLTEETKKEPDFMVRRITSAEPRISSDRIQRHSPVLKMEGIEHERRDKYDMGIEHERRDKYDMGIEHERREYDMDSDD